MSKAFRGEGEPRRGKKPELKLWQEMERKRKNGVRRWQSEVDRFGSEVIPKIPADLLEAVIGVNLEELNYGMVEERTPVALMDKLLKTAPVRQGVNEYHELEKILRRVNR
jgi:hypothetical protein